MQKLNDDTLIEDIPFAVVDIETTGLSARRGDRITEICVIRVKNKREENCFQTLLNPERPIPYEVLAISGITDEMVKDAPVFAEVVNEFLPLFQEAVIVCHNASFDMGFINGQLKNIGLPAMNTPKLDTLVLARKYFNFQGNSLSKIANQLDIKCENVHRAESDVRTTIAILNYFIEKLKEEYNIRTFKDLKNLLIDF